MPVCFICLAARAVIQDAQNNQISAFSIIDQITPQALPALVPDVGVLAVWRSADDDRQQDIPITFRASNNQRELLAVNLSINFREANIHRSIVAFSPFLIYEPGFVEFAFSHDNDVLGSYRVEVLPAIQAQVTTPRHGQQVVTAAEPPAPPEQIPPEEQP